MSRSTTFPKNLSASSWREQYDLADEGFHTRHNSWADAEHHAPRVRVTRFDHDED